MDLVLREIFGDAFLQFHFTVHDQMAWQEGPGIKLRFCTRFKELPALLPFQSFHDPAVKTHNDLWSSIPKHQSLNVKAAKTQCCLRKTANHASKDHMITFVSKDHMNMCLRLAFVHTCVAQSAQGIHRRAIHRAA